MLKLKKEMREVSAAASDQRANRHRLIADYWWLITVIGGATIGASGTGLRGGLKI